MKLGAVSSLPNKSGVYEFENDFKNIPEKYCQKLVHSCKRDSPQRWRIQHRIPKVTITDSWHSWHTISRPMQLITMKKWRITDLGGQECVLQYLMRSCGLSSCAQRVGLTTRCWSLCMHTATDRLKPTQQDYSEIWTDYVGVCGIMGLRLYQNGFSPKGPNQNSLKFVNIVHQKYPKYSNAHSG